MAARTASLIQAAPYNGIVSDSSGQVDLGQIKTNQINFLNYFTNQIGKLRDIVDTELRQEPLNATQLQFIDSLMQLAGKNYSDVRLYNGWYPTMYYFSSVNRSWPETDFYPAKYGPTKFDALVVDVHTDVPDIFFCVNYSYGVLQHPLGHYNLIDISTYIDSRWT